MLRIMFLGRPAQTQLELEVSRCLWPITLPAVECSPEQEEAGLPILSSRLLPPLLPRPVPKGLEASGNGETIRVFSGGEAFASGPAVRDMAFGAISSVERLQRMAEHCKVYVALHADHCQPKNPDGFFLSPVPENERRRQAGVSSLSNNPMSDGSGIRS